MALLSLLSAPEIQMKLADSIRRKRKKFKWSRRELAERSTVPEATLRRFEETGEIALRQFVLLWQCVDRLDRLADLTKEEPPQPRTIEEVIRG